MKCKVFVILSLGKENEKKSSEEISAFLEGKKIVRTEQSSATVDSIKCHALGETNKHIKLLATHLTIFYEEN